ncbi:MAG: hypothetical protein AVDCRST_MAG59-2765 [uncultured Thermomicrobiales bacterium]|uniref:Uncharacterized protein n=1 Tax=uncultured Thermomicrobiales bacterium TaxID=1645740 RepID=A0A6J4V029_9BACT|nr:MAG: hypothetical protein AVDCRST_MAG59-2765 [uncultured Thermomicrobiales bacterium]
MPPTESRPRVAGPATHFGSGPVRGLGGTRWRPVDEVQRDRVQPRIDRRPGDIILGAVLLGTRGLAGTAVAALLFGAFEAPALELPTLCAGTLAN